MAAHTLPNPLRCSGLFDASGGPSLQHPTKSPAWSKAETKGAALWLRAMKTSSAWRTSSDLLMCACLLSRTKSCSNGAGDFDGQSNHVTLGCETFSAPSHGFVGAGVAVNLISKGCNLPLMTIRKSTSRQSCERQK